MLPLDDSRWNSYQGALGAPCRCVPILHQLLESGGNKEIWDFCWNHFVYQAEIGEVSYAATPYLAATLHNPRRIDWNVLALISAIELARPTGPGIPSEIQNEYFQTIESIPLLLARHPQNDWDELTTRCAASCIALAHGQRDLARIYAEMSLSEGIEWLEERGE